jgi:hypothetical protein
MQCSVAPSSLATYSRTCRRLGTRCPWPPPTAASTSSDAALQFPYTRPYTTHTGFSDNSSKASYSENDIYVYVCCCRTCRGRVGPSGRDWRAAARPQSLRTPPPPPATAGTQTAPLTQSHTHTAATHIYQASITSYRLGTAVAPPPPPQTMPPSLPPLVKTHRPWCAAALSAPFPARARTSIATAAAPHGPAARPPR